MLSKFWGLRLQFEPCCKDLSLEATISASTLEFEPHRWDMNLEAGSGSQGWDKSLKAGIRASRLELEQGGWD